MLHLVVGVLRMHSAGSVPLTIRVRARVEQALILSSTSIDQERTKRALNKGFVEIEVDAGRSISARFVSRLAATFRQAVTPPRARGGPRRDFLPSWLRTVVGAGSKSGCNMIRKNGLYGNVRIQFWA